MWRKSLKSEFLIYKNVTEVRLRDVRRVTQPPQISTKEEFQRTPASHIKTLLSAIWPKFSFSSCFSFLLAFVFVLVVFLQFYCKWFYWFKLVNTFWQVDGNMCSLRKQVKKCSGYINNIIKAFVFSNWSVVESIRR